MTIDYWNDYYWNVANDINGELQSLASAGNYMYGALETNDDLGEIADRLDDIRKRLDKLSTQIDVNIVPLRKITKALGDLPGVRL